MDRRTSGVLIAFAALLWVAAPGWSQVERGQFDVNIGGGVALHPNSSALQSVSPILNLKGRAFLNDNVGLGFSVDYARTETDDDIFPLAQFVFSTADSTLYVALKQPVAIFSYQFLATLGAPVSEGAFYPYIMGGIGGYTLYLDPQEAEGPERQSDLALTVGGAVKLRLAGNSAIELSVRDVIFTGYERDRLNPTPPRDCRANTERQFTGDVCANERFPFLDPAGEDPSETVHNIVLSASFSFFPRL